MHLPLVISLLSTLPFTAGVRSSLSFDDIYRLQNPTNGAVLGTQTLSTITISSSDDPSGIFGFSAATLSGFVVNNPSVASGASSIRLTLERSAGLNGNVTVSHHSQQQHTPLRLCTIVNSPTIVT